MGQARAPEDRLLETQEKAPDTSSHDAPALKADDLGGAALGEAVGGQMRGGDVGAAVGGLGGAIQRKPADAAAEGTSGAAHEIPHRPERERSFGMDFGGVQAFPDRKAQGASRELGAHAYAVGNQVAFASPNPDQATVAHELTHVVQAGGAGPGGAEPAGAAPARKSTASGRDTEIDTSGEGEAEKVESAVKAGKPAKSALQGGVAKQGGPRLKSGRGIARKEGTPFTLGMTFSPEGFEKQYWWNLWSAPEFEIPIPAVPGLNFKISPEVKILASGGVNWKEKALEAQLKLAGIVGVGFGYGKSELAEVYGVMEANAMGGFDYKKLSGGGEEHAEGGHAEHAPESGSSAHAAEHAPEAKHEAKSWELSGNIALSTNFAVGVELGGGWVDYRFEFGECQIGQLTGLNWKDGHFDKGAVGWEWGPKPKEFFAAMRHVLAKAKQLQPAGVEAYRQGMDMAKRTAQNAFNAGRDVVNWVSSW
jgi:hypothetical protein